MSVRTLYLSELVALSSAFPAQAARIGPAPRRWLVPALVAVVAGLAWYVAPVSGVLAVPSWYWYPVAVAVGAVLPLLELGIGVAIARSRRLPVAGFAVRGTAVGVAAAVVTAAGEEVAYRGVGLHLLETVLRWPSAFAIGVTAVAYGLNHLWFGRLTVAQKMVTGVALGTLYDLSGRAVVVPLVAHVVQNLVVLLALPRWLGRR
jgi:hypothetical protein